MTATYDCIATTTLGSAQSSVTFSSISGSFTDLVLIANYIPSTGNSSMTVRFNSDSGANYSNTYLYGDGSSAVSGGFASQTLIKSVGRGNSNGGTTIVQMQNYSNSTTYKTLIGKGGTAADLVITTVGLWRDTNAITSVTVGCENTGVNFNSGSTFTLYGIKAE